MRARQISLQTQVEISRLLSPLKIKIVWQETHHTVTEDSGILCQEAIEIA
jgi:hypothetical protein